jgi:tetratricopeptide (TPR) repeat protein
LCGYLPLALRIAGALLRHRPAWPLEHLARKLRDQHQRVGALSDGDRKLAAVFDLSYASLDGTHQLLWRRLGLVPGTDLDAYAAAAVAEAGPAVTTELLEDLVDDNLLIAYSAGRYRLHDLLRAHAHSLATADPVSDREAVLDRLLHYYAHTSQSASLAMARYPRAAPTGPAPAHAPVPQGPEAARSWLRTEQPNLEASFAYSRAQSLGRHAIALAAGLAEILLNDGPWSRALDIHQAAADIAGRAGQAEARAHALTELGRMRALVGDNPGAGAALAGALEGYRQLGHHLGEANALNGLGRVRALTGAYLEAGEILARSLEVYRLIGHRLGEANVLNDLARLKHVTGEYVSAGDAATRALAIYHALGHRQGQANTLTDLGRLRHLTGDYAEAADALTEALEIYRALGYRLGEANALTDLSRVRQETGNYRGAGEALTSALEIYQILGNRNGEAYALTNLGYVRHLAGNQDGAASALTSALEIYDTLGDRGNTAWALNYYAATLAASGERGSALRLYEKALAMNQELNKLDDEAGSLEGIAEYYLAAGDPGPGSARLRQALEIYQRLGMDREADRVRTRLTDLAAL